MILNNFSKIVVIDVFSHIKENDNTDLICSGFIEEFENEELAMLMYHPEIHRLDLRQFRKDEPLYPNPDCISILAPREVFIKNIYPGQEYLSMMKK